MISLLGLGTNHQHRMDKETFQREVDLVAYGDPGYDIIYAYTYYAYTNCIYLHNILYVKLSKMLKMTMSLIYFLMFFF